MSGWVAGAVAVGSVAGGYYANKAAENAADKSAAATAAAVAEQRRQYDQTRADMQPWMQAGTGAVNRLGAGVAANGEHYGRNESRLIHTRHHWCSAL